MISFKELIKDTLISDIPINHQHNLEILLAKVNEIRKAYNKPMYVSSGYRSRQKHLDIYRKKGFTDDKIPWGSQHLSGCAVDFSDPKKELQTWILNNIELIEQLDVFIEDFKHTPTWVHIQIHPFRSYRKDGSRFFIP